MRLYVRISKAGTYLYMRAARELRFKRALRINPGVREESDSGTVGLSLLTARGVTLQRIRYRLESLGIPLSPLRSHTGAGG